MKRILSALLALAALGACTAPAAPDTRHETIVPAYRRAVDPKTYTGIKFSAWDIGEAAKDFEPQPFRTHTLLIYINGSDLESETGAATDDINEMLRSRTDTSDLNIVLFTGGANRWEKAEIPAAECVVSRINDGELERIAGLGKRNMGDAGTLASFIAFGTEYFPAEKYSLILWDHGGGTIAGYGMDEHFEDGALSLLEMEYAFERAGLGERKLEMLGFDACLMASAEMAVVAARYAEYLVASEALEPQDGWDYGVLRRLGRDPAMSGGEFGRHIVDAYILSGGVMPREEMSLSVVRLDEAENVMGAMGALMERCRAELDGGGFDTLSRLRAGTKSFGGGSPLDMDCDMVDLYDLTLSLADMFPDEALALRGALARAVIYNRYASKTKLGGLSSYYIYGDRTDAEQAIGVYRSLAMSGAYTEYLGAFAERLYGSKTRTRGAAEPAVTARLLDGETVLYEIAQPPRATLYAAPARVNGGGADIVVYAPDGGDAGRVLGYRFAEGYLIQKGYIEFDGGDVVEFLDIPLVLGGAEAADNPVVITRPVVAPAA